MGKPIGIRFDEELLKKLKAETEKTGKSIGQLVNELTEKGFKYDSTTDIQEMRLILLKYHTKCLKCGCDLPPNTWALYGKGVGAVCRHCFIEKLGDKAIIKKDMMLEEIKWKLKAYEKSLADKREEMKLFNFLEQVKAMRDATMKHHALAMDWLKTGFAKTELERKAIEDNIRLAEEMWKMLDDLKLFMKGPPLKKKKIQYAT